MSRRTGHSQTGRSVIGQAISTQHQEAIWLNDLHWFKTHPGVDAFVRPHSRGEATRPAIDDPPGTWAAITAMRAQPEYWVTLVIRWRALHLDKRVPGAMKGLVPIILPDLDSSDVPTQLRIPLRRRGLGAALLAVGSALGLAPEGTEALIHLRDGVQLDDEG